MAHTCTAPMVHASTGRILPEILEIFATSVGNEVFVKALKDGKLLIFEFVYDLTRPDSFQNFVVAQFNNAAGEDLRDREDFDGYFYGDYASMLQYFAKPLIYALVSGKIFAGSRNLAANEIVATEVGRR